MKHDKTSSGSALVIVMGMLSVLMLMAVAFSSFMRTERGATTNLKNAQVAEQSLQSAIALAIQSIEDSLSETQDGYSNAVVNNPVVLWPQPWLASCGDSDRDRASDGYFMSRVREGTKQVPNILAAEAAEFLTSNQIAMIRSADVGFAPISSGMRARGLWGEEEVRQGVRAGYPTSDEPIGRYAFVALDTTGYLDLGKIGQFDANDRKKSTGDDPWAFIPVEEEAEAPNGRDIDSPFKSNGPSKLKSAVNDAKAFFSFADVKRQAERSGSYAAFDLGRPSDHKNKNFIPPDVYAGTGVSLEPLTPEGEPKVHVPTGSEYESGSFDSRSITALVRRSFPAMMSVFAQSRKEGELEHWWNDPEPIRLYRGHRTSSVRDAFKISRASLATVGLLDMVDTDVVPGKSTKYSREYWVALKEMGEVVVPVWDADAEQWRDVEDQVKGNDDPLNFPCTEPGPLVQMFYAYITIDKDSGSISAAPEGQGRDPGRTGDAYAYQKTYNATLHVGARAADSNRVDDGSKREYDLEIVFDVMDEKPKGTKIVSAGSGGQDEAVYERINYFPEREMRVEWKGLFRENEKIKESNRIVESFDGGDRSIRIQKDYPFTITFNVERPGSLPVTYEGVDYQTAAAWKAAHPDMPIPGTTFYDNVGFTGQECYEKESGDPKKDAWIPLRFMATVSCRDGDIQQVPAPCIGSASEKSYWVRLDVGAYHPAGSSVLDDIRGNALDLDGSKGDLAAGWAFCLAPQFAMDTTSLAMDAGDSFEDDSPTWDSPMKFWLNNVCAHAGYDPNGGRESATRNNILAQTAAIFDDPEECEAELDTPPDGRNGSLLTLQTSFLFDNEDYWFKWFNDVANGDGDTSCADMMHTLGKDESTWLLDWKTSGTRNQTRRNLELFTRLPVDGLDSVADMGKIMIGPYQTLSLFKTWRPPDPVDDYGSSYPVSDFHPVFDYFTMAEDRYPTSSDISGNVASDGTVDWDKLGGGSARGKNQHHLFSAVQSGRVNLNLPRLLEPFEDRSANKLVRVKRSDYYNPYPLATAINGAPYPYVDGTRMATNGVSEKAAVKMAEAFAKALSHADKHPSRDDFKEITMTSHVTNLVHRANDNDDSTSPDDGRIHAPAIRNVSAIAASGVNSSSNAVLQAFMGELSSRERDSLCDAMRESVLGGFADALTTRGQSFLLAIRADAYTAAFGMGASSDGGTTLATSRALVELFRDPEPARRPDGTFPLDDEGNPVLYHNWFIRSFRMF